MSDADRETYQNVLNGLRASGTVEDVTIAAVRALEELFNRIERLEKQVDGLTSRNSSNDRAIRNALSDIG